MTDEIHPDGLPTPRRYLAMLAIAIGIAMAVLDGTVVNVALPSIARELGASPSAAVWVINAYQLVIVALLLPLASLGERIGYRRIYAVGVVVFSLGSLGCALSDRLPELIAARVLQGIGGAAIMSMNGALVRHTYPDAHLGRGIGLNGLVVAIAAAVAPSLAAGILAVGPWPWLFAVNVPFGLLNLWLARHLPRAEQSGRAFDWTSALLSAAMFGLFFVGADTLTREGADLPAAAGLVVAAAAAVMLVRRGLRTPAPLIPVDLFRNPVFALSVTASICAFAAFAITFVALPFYFQTALGRDQVETGLLMTPWPVALGFAALLAGRLSDRIPAGTLGGLGMAAVALGLALLSRLSPELGHARDHADDGALRLRLRLLPGAEQPHDARRGAARALRRGGRDAVARPAARDDPRRHRDGARLPRRARPGGAGQPADRHGLRDRRRHHERAPPVNGAIGPGRALTIQPRPHFTHMDSIRRSICIPYAAERRKPLRSGRLACWQGR